MLPDRQKWNRAADSYENLAARAAERRWADYKRAFFAEMRDGALFLAAGTGLDFQFFPHGRRVVAVDVSEAMLQRAAERGKAYDGAVTLHQMDIRQLAFSNDSFEQIYTSCTFCSVTDPLGGLRQLRRVLKPGGVLRMFEHTGSRWFPFGAMLTACTPLSRRYGPEMNRPTVETVGRAGFRVRRVECHFLDVLKTIEAEVE